MPSQYWNDPIRLEPGLYVVSTPIGNLGDITLRGIKTLISADLIAAEDTRVSVKLLNHYGIKTPLFSCHEYNEEDRCLQIVDHISRGKSVALITDAGTPLISDPGFRVVRAVADAGYDVVSVPGPSAFTAALSVSGLSTDAFTFIGFPPNKKAKRIAWLKQYASFSHPIICYESPHRILGLLQDAISVLGDRESVLCREITKLHEEKLRGTLSDIHAVLEDREKVKGEITLIIAGGDTNPEIPQGDIYADIVDGLSAGESASKLAKRLSKSYGIQKNDAYGLILEQKEHQ